MSEGLRTAEEIAERFLAVKDHEDFFGVYQGRLSDVISFEDAKRLLPNVFDYDKEGAREAWEKDQIEYTRENIIAEINNYMPFAIMKAEDERGLSANRSLNHFEALIWLIKENTGELEDLFKDYREYGMPMLKLICKRFGFDFEERRGANYE